ncbi:MAG: hypothetical protein ACQ9IQ_14540 [Nitrospirales bacterium]
MSIPIRLFRLYLEATPASALVTSLRCKPLGFALLLLCVAIFANGVASAADAPSVPDDPCFIPPMLTRSPPETNGQPVQVQIGVLLIDVVEIDDVTESFTTDFKVRIRWKDPRLSAVALGHSLENCRFSIDDVWTPDIQPINQRGTVQKGKLQYWVASDGTVSVVARVFTILSNPLDMHDFPFDTQHLRIQFASMKYNPTEVTFITDEARTGRLEGLSIPGWKLLNNFSDDTIAPLQGAVRNHSRFDHLIVIERQSSYYVWKFIVPLCFIVLMASGVFWLNPAGVQTQVGVGTASVFTLIAFILGLRTVLPRVPYLTRMDLLVFSATVLVFLALLEVIITSRYAQKGHTQLAQTIDRYARWMYPLAFLVLLVFSLKW